MGRFDSKLGLTVYRVYCNVRTVRRWYDFRNVLCLRYDSFRTRSMKFDALSKRELGR